MSILPGASLCNMFYETYIKLMVILNDLLKWKKVGFIYKLYLQYTASICTLHYLTTRETDNWEVCIARFLLFEKYLSCVLFWLY